MSSVQSQCPAGPPGLPPARTLLLEFCVVVFIGMVILTAVTFYIDNTNLVTTNGLWKSINVNRGIEGGFAWIDESNLLYYPVTQVLAGVLPEAVFGPVWRRMAFVNVGWAALTLGFLHLLLRGLSLSRGTAACGVVFQLGCAFFLALAITSEDIMAGMAFLVGTMALAVFVSRRPTVLGAAGVGFMFSLAWLFEWRLMFPTGPALVLALAVLQTSTRQKLKLGAVAAASCLILPFLFAAILTYTGRHAGVFDGLWQILWTGKGVGTMWAGFSNAKVVFLGSGMTLYLFEGHNHGSLEFLLTTSSLLKMVGKFLIILPLLALFCRAFWSRRHEPAWRMAGILLGGTFVFGELFNLYSQPQDPQMQINVMIWLPVAWAVFARKLHPGSGKPFRSIAALILSLAPLSINLAVFSGSRGLDSRNLAGVEILEGIADPESTVFVTHGQEGYNTWRAATWGYEHPPVLDKPPQPEPGYKVIFLTDAAQLGPTYTPDESAQYIVSMIDNALDRGFRVVINDTWEWTESRLMDSFARFHSPERSGALYRALKGRYRAVLLSENTDIGRHFELHRNE